MHRRCITTKYSTGDVYSTDVMYNAGNETGSFYNVTGHFDNVTGHFDNVTGQCDNMTGQCDNMTGQCDNMTGHFDNVTAIGGARKNTRAPPHLQRKDTIETRGRISRILAEKLRGKPSTIRRRSVSVGFSSESLG
ncbi:hypothetical protein HYPBUDRAFT_148448 [Hyphopichia burtonii NRRL Y-1933]|uniref:Uncharacterized protein n=1 Tax=Hyphopichia burtonii NRRL Y-1933 TaxID=984485 RepID=A0A1E4RLN1_9ASCO|nr:hypothetical protein HYPBUDRAFT_148448 [Hyphopichia burtonii NRRL Y-1933]ODV68172.1 hypothetical protein HYPBUDRAFT_148448 [Hyphopichia burtonii NRRL Y-1933]